MPLFQTFDFLAYLVYFIYSKKNKMDYADNIIMSIKRNLEFKQILDSIVEDGYKDNIKEEYKQYLND